MVYSLELLDPQSFYRVIYLSLSLHMVSRRNYIAFAIGASISEDLTKTTVGLLRKNLRFCFQQGVESVKIPSKLH